jgi:hypothetical protein
MTAINYLIWAGVALVAWICFKAGAKYGAWRARSGRS